MLVYLLIYSCSPVLYNNDIVVFRLCLISFINNHQFFTDCYTVSTHSVTTLIVSMMIRSYIEVKCDLFR